MPYYWVAFYDYQTDKWKCRYFWVRDNAIDYADGLWFGPERSSMLIEIPGY